MRSDQFFPAAIVASIAAASGAAAEAPAGAHMMAERVSTVTISATCDSAVAPDSANVSAGVQTEGATAALAMAANAKQMTAVFAELRKAGVADRDIQTSNLNLSPTYAYPNNEQPKLTGYMVTNTVSVNIKKLDKVGAAIDAIVRAGVNNINGVTFAVENPEPLLDKARAEAMTKAMKRASLYASAAGMKVKRVISIQEGSNYSPPMPIYAMAKMADTAESAPTPVSGGSVALSASVTVEFELEPAK